jgi:hypothetical protein
MFQFLGLTGFLWFASGLLTLHAATTVKMGAVTQIRGAKDLDLEGEILYAINFSADDGPRKVRGITFLPDTQKIVGATLVGPQQVTSWQTKPEFGGSVDDDQLEEIFSDIRWAVAGSGERLRASLTVVAGEQYKLQILISGNSPEDRRWDIRVGGSEAVDEMTSLGVAPGQAYFPDRATLYTCEITATSGVLVVEMGNLFGTVDGGDRNPIWQALTLERITVPPAPQDILLEPAEFSLPQPERIGQLRVVDGKPNATHDLTWVAGEGDADNTKFVISGGAVLPGLFDFSKLPPGSLFSIRVRATDSADAKRFLEKAIRIKLTEPHAPSGLRLDATSVSASARIGERVARVVVEDVDLFDTHSVALAKGVGDVDNTFFEVVAGDVRLMKPLPAGQPSARFRLRATDNTGRWVEQAFELSVLPPRVRITEIQANEMGGVPDEGSVLREWIEIYNELPQYVDLSGWALSNDQKDPGQWKFPPTTLAPGEFLVILADGLGISPAGSKLLHTTFSISSEGEWVGLFRPGFSVVESELKFPRQFPGVSYGQGVDGGLGYLKVPTPGAANGARTGGGENPVGFSRDHGFFTETFTVELTAALPESVIRYTLDGTAPTASTGSLYEGPITVTPNTSGIVRGTRVVRAIAVHSAAAYSPVGTRTYLFVNGVTGPATDGIVGQTRLLPSITKHATYGPLLDDAFLALPAVSVVMGTGPSTTERLASVELLDPENREPGFQIDCGVAATGTTSLGSPKLSMSARFRTKYGPAKLRYPVFARGSRFSAGAATEFNELRLRSHSHDTFYWLGTKENPPVPYGSPSVTRSGDAQLARNPWIDEMQLAMGQPGKHGRQVHLFLNGSYHGIYHIHEHPDEDFMASYYPGPREDFHFSGGATTGSDHGRGDHWRVAWSSLKSSLNNYPQAKRWIDITNLCDSMVLSFYAGNDWDWSAQHNWAAAGPRLADRGGWKFFQQDSDITLQDVAADCTDQDVPDGIFTALMRQSDFRVLFRDRLYRHCFGDGVLTPARASAAYNSWMEELRLPIVAETARWQPSSSVAALPWDRDQEWANEWRYLRETFFPARTARLIQQIRKRSGWWPADPPILSASPGPVPAGQRVGFTSPVGKVYFTIDGSDPRVSGGGIAAGVLTQPVAIDRPMLLRARVYTGTDWSAIVESYFVPEGMAQASSRNLILSEIQYHPREVADTEFLEFLNTSGATVDLSDVVVTNAVFYRFPKATLLGAGERLVLAKDLNAFDARYGATTSPYYRAGVRVLGPWIGTLSNAGERIEVLAADGATAFICVYGTDGGWPNRADGGGSSLELLDPVSAPSSEGARSAWLGDPRRWRASAEFHGSPGSAGGGQDRRVVLNEVLAAPAIGGEDFIELINTSGDVVDITGWYLSDSSADYRKYLFPATVLGPRARFVLGEKQFNNPANAAARVPFALDRSGDDVFLVQADRDGTLRAFVDWVDLGPSRLGISWGRFPEGTGPWRWIEGPTPGLTNGLPVAGYEAWAAATFRRGFTPERILPGADADGDGIDNFTVYAFVLQPESSGPRPLEVISGVGSQGMTLAYRIRTAATDLAYRLELSTDLHTWIDAGGEVSEVSRAAQSDGSTRVVARLGTAVNGSATARFVRVSARLR